MVIWLQLSPQNRPEATGNLMPNHTQVLRPTPRLLIKQVP